VRLRSLRSRLIAWYVTTGLLLVLCFAVLTAIVTGDAISYQAREALLAAQRQIPGLAEQYQAQHGTIQGFDAYSRQRLAPLPVVTRTEALTDFLRGGQPRRPPPRENLLVRLLMEETHPLIVRFDGARTIIFVSPSFYNRFLEYYFIAMAIVAAVVGIAAWRIAIVVAASSLDPLLRTTAALNRFGDGDFTPAVVSTNDTSEVGELAQAYNRAVRQITRALEERARASAEMRQFVADAGHQLRTPLTVVIGYLSSMVTRTPRESDAPQIATMLTQSRRMKILIDDLITLARLEHVAPLPEKSFDPNDVVRELPQAFPPHDQQRFCLQLSATPLTVHAAPTEFREALVALTDNAVKYGGKGPVTISVDRAGSTCEIVVSDCGPGFSNEDLTSAFDRFYRGNASEGTTGTGLGLAIAAKAVARAKGIIRLFNVQGGGAGCVVQVPLA
jgi:signal transduction histidine kinase